MTSTYADINYPVSFSNNVFAVLPVEYDTANLGTSRGFTFSILENTVKLTGCRIVCTDEAGAFYVVAIGEPVKKSL